MFGVYNWWDTLQTGSGAPYYTSSPIRANECTYETSGLMRGLKTSNKFYNVSSGSWNLQRTETYGFDSNLGYLTSANYGDGLSNATPSWTYDAAGNRASDSTNTGTWSYDNLNRMTASPGAGGYSNDILGNRSSKGSGSTATTYSWDELNRLTGFSQTNNSNAYVYRADGMRVSKSATGSASSQLSTCYRYDDEMGIEDVDKNASGSITAISRFAIGVRGIEAISRTTSSGTNVSYPLYDAHGNNVGLLSKSGTAWSIADERTYGAWGQVRSGSSTGDQKGRYCANIGHNQDDESGLIYMRARYFDPNCGRFISEDSDKAKVNWYSYCDNDPIDQADQSGCSPASTLFWAIFGASAWVPLTLLESFGISRILANPVGKFVLVTGFAMIAASFVLSDITGERIYGNGDLGDRTTCFGVIFGVMLAIFSDAALAPPTLAENAIMGIAAYATVIGLYMALDAVQDGAIVASEGG